MRGALALIVNGPVGLVSLPFTCQIVGYTAELRSSDGGSLGSIVLLGAKRPDPSMMALLLASEWPWLRTPEVPCYRTGEGRYFPGFARVGYAEGEQLWRKPVLDWIHLLHTAGPGLRSSDSNFAVEGRYLNALALMVFVYGCWRQRRSIILSGALWPNNNSVKEPSRQIPRSLSCF